MKTKINSIGIEKDTKDTTVVVAMSGGVDSSTVAGTTILIFNGDGSYTV